MPNYHIHVVTLIPRDNNERLLALSGAEDENISILENQLDVSIGGNSFDLKILFKKEFNKEYYQEKHFTSSFQEHSQYVEKIIKNLYEQTLVNGKVNHLSYSSVMATIRSAREMKELEFLRKEEHLKEKEEYLKEQQKLAQDKLEKEKAEQVNKEIPVGKAQASSAQVVSPSDTSFSITSTSTPSNPNPASSSSMSKAPTAADAIALIEAERKKRIAQNKTSSPFATFDTPVTIPKDEPDRPDREELRARREEARLKREAEKREAEKKEAEQKEASFANPAKDHLDAQAKERAFNLDAQLLNDFENFQAGSQASTSLEGEAEELTIPTKGEGAPNPGFSLLDDKTLGEDLFEPIDTSTFTTSDFSDIDLFAEDGGEVGFAQSLDNLDLFSSFIENEEKSEAVSKPLDMYAEEGKTNLKAQSSLTQASSSKEEFSPYDDLSPKTYKEVRDIPVELARELGWVADDNKSTKADNQANQEANQENNQKVESSTLGNKEKASLKELGIEEYIRRLSDEDLDGNPEDDLALETFSEHRELIDRIEQTVQDFASEGKGYGFIMDALERMYRKEQVELFEEYQRTVVDYRDLLNIERDRREEEKEAAKAAQAKSTEAKRQEAANFWSQQKANTLSPADKVAKAREILNKQKQKSEAPAKTKAQELAELAEGGSCGSGCGCGGHDHGRPVLNYPKKPLTIAEPGQASTEASSATPSKGSATAISAPTVSPTTNTNKKVLSPSSVTSKTAPFVKLDKEKKAESISSANSTNSTNNANSINSTQTSNQNSQDANPQALLANSTLAFSREAQELEKREAEANKVYGSALTEEELLSSLPCKEEKPSSLSSGKPTKGVVIKPRGPKVISGIVTNNEDDEKANLPKSKLQTPLTTPMSKSQLRQKEKYMEHKGEFTKIGRGKITPQTINQQLLVDNINENDITFALGPAGCGKSFIAVAMAVDALLENRVRRIILTRPAVEAGEKLGFLPGDIAQKLDPYLKPLYDAMVDILGAEKVSTLLEKGIVEIAPLAFMRGRTLSNAFIILDEAQNTTVEQMKMFLTRLGFDSKMVVTGDTSQIDLPKSTKSGIVHAQEVLDNIPGLSFSFLYSKDVVRHHTVTKVVEAYEQYEALNQQKAAKKPRVTKEEMLHEVLSSFKDTENNEGSSILDGHHYGQE